MGTLHCVLENGEDLYVNECQKILHYRARSTEERRRRMPNGFFFTSCSAYVKLRYNFLYCCYKLIGLEISHKTR